MQASDIQIGLTQLAAILGGGVGIGWVLMKLLFSQFREQLKEQFAGMNGRLEKVEQMALKIQNLEVESAKRDAAMSLHYVLREEYRVDQVEMKQSLNQIFNLLRDVQRGLDAKIDKGSCVGKCQ